MALATSAARFRVARLQPRRTAQHAEGCGGPGRHRRRLRGASPTTAPILTPGSPAHPVSNGVPRLLRDPVVVRPGRRSVSTSITPSARARPPGSSRACCASSTRCSATTAFRLTLTRSATKRGGHRSRSGYAEAGIFRRSCRKWRRPRPRRSTSCCGSRAIGHRLGSGGGRRRGLWFLMLS